MSRALANLQTELEAAGISFSKVQLRNAELEIASAGDPAAPLVVLLHGFPESYLGWRHQIVPLAAAGFRVVAPNQRGYAGSSKPPHVRDYRLDHLAGDVADLIHQQGRSQAIVVGHDWGAAVAWYLAATIPAVVAKLAILNVPHPLVMRKVLRTSLRQFFKSWYMLVFQLPWLPELMARRHQFAPLRKALTESSRAGTFTDAELAAYAELWSIPGAYTTMLHWYRAAFRYGQETAMPPRITPATLMLWGCRDQFLAREMAQPSIDCCDQGTLHFFEEATHWIQHEEPHRVNELLLEFFRR